MTNCFYSQIKNIEAQMNKLKTVGLSSSSSLSVSYQDFTIPVQIIGTRIVSGEVLRCSASKYANIYLQPSGGEAALFTMEIIAPSDLQDRPVVLWNRLSDILGYKYKRRILVEGNANDLAALNRGETIPTVNYVFRIKSTSLFTATVTYTDVEIDYE